MKLAQNEKIIKETCYATSKKVGISGKTEECWLTLTNRRIVSSRRTKSSHLGVGGASSFDSKELSIKDVVGVNSCFYVRSNFAPIFIIVFGIISIISGLIGAKFSGVFAVFCIVGIVALITGIMNLNQYKLSFDFMLRGFTTNGMHIGAGHMRISSKKQVNLDLIDVRKYTVNKEAISEIINEIGAIIMDNQ